YSRAAHVQDYPSSPVRFPCARDNRVSGLDPTERQIAVSVCICDEGLRDMRFLKQLLSLVILIVPIVLAWVLPPKLYPELRQEPPARLLRIGALSGQIILIWCALVLALLAWLT